MDKLSISGIVTGVVGSISAIEIGNLVLTILSILSVLISLICGVINIIGKIKKAAKDGYISPEEMDEIAKELRCLDEILNNYGAEGTERLPMSSVPDHGEIQNEEDRRTKNKD